MKLTTATLKHFSLCFLLSGCAVLHSVQVGDIDSQTILGGEPFLIKVSELGLNTEDVVAIGQALAKNSGSADEVGAVGDIIELFQMGPRTGNPTFTDEYTDTIRNILLQECPSGQITGLMAIRETAQYPVVSGEIVRVVGHCIQD